MKKIILITAAVLLLAFALTGCAKQAPVVVNPDGEDSEILSTVSVTGTGKLELMPDTARIYLGVNINDSDNATSEAVKKQADEKISAIIKAISALGVKEEDIRTDSYYINKDYRYNNKGEIIKTYYSAYISLEVKVRNTDNTEKVINEAVAAGADFSDGIYFFIDDKSQAEGEALALAFEDARKKAEIICEAAGKKVGDALVITDGTTELPEVYQNYTAKDAVFAEGEPTAAEASDMGGGAESTQIMPGTVTITSNVSVRFEMN